GATVVSGGTSRIAAIYIKSAGSGTAPVYVTGYQNLNVGNVTSHAVTGLNPTTNYYYVVRATNASGISASSNEIAVSTIAGPLPSLSATTLVDFGSVTVGQNSTAQTFDLSGINLTGAPGSITVNAPSADFQVSSDNINWSSSTTVAYTSSTLAATQVYVRFTPQSSGLKSGNIAVAGGGATISVAVSGTGINPLPPVAPVAIAATNISSNGFTANWNAVAGATAYLLDVYTMGTGSGSSTIAGWNFSFNNSSSDVADAGNTNNIGIQTVSGIGLNTISYPGGPTGSSGVNPYSISANGWDNGADTKYWQINLNATGVTGLSLSSLQGSSNTGPAAFKIQYRVGASGTWTDVPGGTVTITVVPSPGNPATFFGPTDLPLPSAVDNQPNVSVRWLQTSNTAVNGSAIASNGTSRISAIYVKGNSAGSVPVFVPGYQNLNVGNVTSYNVTGLAPNTNYYYVVRATNAAGTSVNSNEINVVTAPDLNPNLNATALTAFGNVCINTIAGPHSFTITGSNLTPGDITVAAVTGYSFSTTANGVYAPTLNISQPGGSFSQQVFVRFNPTAVQNYNGSIGISGGGVANPAQVAVTGAGINSLPGVSTGSASNIGLNAATVAGSITANGCSAISAYGIEYSTVNNFAPGTGTQVTSGNLSGSNFTSVLSGLTLNTLYYYRAFATNGAGTAYGPQQSFTTLATPPVTLTATALTAFGNICANTISDPLSFTLTGSNLTNANVVVGPLSGYSFSTTAGGNYTPSISIAQPGGAFSQQVFVRLNPTVAQSFNGNIPVSGGGSTAFTVIASGTGVVT
ncbi:MAG: hypothetical protein H0U44_01990, partial [Flavisolibacter sp.]|nr:hypothetical protein [Flavisolibacter sp.]